MRCARAAGLDSPTVIDEQMSRGFPGATAETSWRTAPESAITSYGLLDMRRAVSEDTYVMVYAYTRVHAETAGKVMLEVQHDDMIKIWINGVHAYTNRSTLPATLTRQLVPVQLRKGPNDVLVKICQLQNNWEFGLRFVSDSGRPVPVTGLPTAPLVR